MYDLHQRKEQGKTNAAGKRSENFKKKKFFYDRISQSSRIQWQLFSVESASTLKNKEENIF
jgi:hypothetical protein